MVSRNYDSVHARNELEKLNISVSEPMPHEPVPKEKVHGNRF